MEQTLKEILTTVKNIDERLSKVEKSIAIIEQDHGSKISALFDGYHHNTEILNRHTERFDRIEADMASERQQIEISQIVHALKHSNEEISAQLHALGYNLNQLTGQVAKCATKEDIDRLALDVAFLVRKTAEHESDIRKIRLAE